MNCREQFTALNMPRQSPTTLRGGIRWVNLRSRPAQRQRPATHAARIRPGQFLTNPAGHFSRALKKCSTQRACEPFALSAAHALLLRRSRATRNRWEDALGPIRVRANCATSAAARATKRRSRAKSRP